MRLGNQRPWYVQPCLCDWVTKDLGMSSLVYATGHIKDPVPLIAKRRGLSPGGRFPPSFIHQVIIITGLNKLSNCMFIQTRHTVTSRLSRARGQSAPPPHQLPHSRGHHIALSTALPAPITPPPPAAQPRTCFQPSRQRCVQPSRQWVATHIPFWPPGGGGAAPAPPSPMLFPLRCPKLTPAVISASF